MEGKNGWEFVTDEVVRNRVFLELAAASEQGSGLRSDAANGSMQKRTGQSSTGGGWLSGISNWFSGLSARSPDEVVKKLYLDVERGNVDAVIASLSRRYVARMGEEKMRALIEEQRRHLESQGGILSIEIETKVDGDTARGHVTMKFKNGREKEERIDLIKEDGKWKIGV